mgnify:FL=1
MRVIKIQLPIREGLLLPLVKRAKPDVLLKVDDSIEFVDRGLFYARLDDGKLTHLTKDEQRHLVTKGLF